MDARRSVQQWLFHWQAVATRQTPRQPQPEGPLACGALRRCGLLVENDYHVAIPRRALHPQGKRRRV